MSDDYSYIRTKIREHRIAEGQRDTDWKTATTDDLDATAAHFDLERAGGEGDETLRSRIKAKLPAQGWDKA